MHLLNSSLQENFHLIFLLLLLLLFLFRSKISGTIASQQTKCNHLESLFRFISFSWCHHLFFSLAFYFSLGNDLHLSFSHFIIFSRGFSSCFREVEKIEWKQFYMIPWIVSEKFIETIHLTWFVKRNSLYFCGVFHLIFITYSYIRMHYVIKRRKKMLSQLEIPSTLPKCLLKWMQMSIIRIFFNISDICLHCICFKKDECYCEFFFFIVRCLYFIHDPSFIPCFECVQWQKDV